MTKIGKYIGLSECAELLGATRSTVRRWFADAGVTAVVLGSGPTGTIRYRAADVEQYLEEASEEEEETSESGDDLDDEGGDLDGDDDGDEDDLDEDDLAGDEEDEDDE